jgi:hypothetical protein
MMKFSILLVKEDVVCNAVKCPVPSAQTERRDETTSSATVQLYSWEAPAEIVIPADFARGSA